MNHRIRKPDPLLLLTLVVGIGVVVTTTVQAETPGLTQAERLQEVGARLALHPVKGLTERLEMHWLNTALDRPAVDQLLTSKPLSAGRPFGESGPELTMSWRPRIAGTAALAGDSGIGAVRTERPDVYIGLHRSW